MHQYSGKGTLARSREGHFQSRDTCILVSHIREKLIVRKSNK